MDKTLTDAELSKLSDRPLEYSPTTMRDIYVHDLLCDLREARRLLENTVRCCQDDCLFNHDARTYLAKCRG